MLFPKNASLGFERLYNNIELVADVMSHNDNFPPHSVVKISENSFEVALAVAGFSKDDVEIECKEDILCISSDGIDRENSGEVLYNRLAFRPFKKMFLMGEHIFVSEASLKDGMLRIKLERKLPYEKKPKRIKLN